MARSLVNPISEKRSRININCEEMKKDDLFDMEECVNFLQENNKLTKYSAVKLPGGALNISIEGNRIVLDLGVDVTRKYIKGLVKKYLQKKGLKDWIHVLAGENGEYALQYYNLTDE